MNFEEIDNYVNNLLKSKYRGFERRDYRELEKNKPEPSPKGFHGYGKKNGVMFLIDIDGNHYIDIRILEDSIRVVFRQDDDDILDRKFPFFAAEFLLNEFFDTVNKYYEYSSKIDKLTSGFNYSKIPVEVYRDIKIDNIIHE